MSQIQATIKRGGDIAASFVALVVLSPLLALVAVLVRLTSPGPAFFRQERLGQGGRPFICCKFRSMYFNAPDIRNTDGSAYNAEDDPRVTRVGRFLRKTSLDELPEFINVLKGDMSLVGPRPDQVDQQRYYTEAERQRLAVKPGITGLAQISGRNSIPWERRKQLDLEYVRRQSLVLDLQILVLTVPYVFMRRDIYVQSDDKPIHNNG